MVRWEFRVKVKEGQIQRISLDSSAPSHLILIHWKFLSHFRTVPNIPRSLCCSSDTPALTTHLPTHYISLHQSSCSLTWTLCKPSAEKPLSISSYWNVAEVLRPHCLVHTGVCAGAAQGLCHKHAFFPDSSPLQLIARC